MSELDATPLYGGVAPSETRPKMANRFWDGCRLTRQFDTPARRAYHLSANPKDRARARPSA